MTKKYITTVIVKGFFNGWSSNLCSVKVVYNPKKEKSYIIRSWMQLCKDDDNWQNPYFPKKQREEITKKAKWNYETFILGNKGIKVIKKIHTNKHHDESRCERCIELGNYCKNGRLNHN